MVLQRGHTVDKLSEVDLQSIVESIDKVRAERAVASASQQLPQQLPKQLAEPEAEGPKAEDKEGKKEEKKEEEKEEKNEKNEEKKEEASKETETKDARRKRLHSRNMRYYRSFLSFSLSMLYRAMHVQGSPPDMIMLASIRK